MGQPGTATPLVAGVLWYHTVAFAVTFAAVWGSLVGSHTAGTRRSPARASAPTARNRGCAAGPDRLGTLFMSRSRGVEAVGIPAALPASLRQGGPQRTAAAGVIPEHLAAAVFHQAGA